MFSIPMPFISLIIPFSASLLIFAQRIYRRAIILKKGIAVTRDKKIIRVALFAIFLLNLILTFIILLHVRTEGTSFYMLSSNGWVRTLSGENQKIHALIQVDALGALSAVVMAFMALGSVLTSLINKAQPLSPTKAGFFLLTLCGVQGVFYSNGLIALSIFMLLTQIGITGLFIPIPSNTKEFKECFWYYSSRFLILGLFFAGAMILYVTFNTDSIVILSNLITGTTNEIVAFVFLLVPMFFLFIKHSPYIEDTSCRCFFRMMSQSAFFVIIKIVFSLYGPTPGLDKIPMLFIFLGLIDLLLVLLSTGRSYDPAIFTENMEQYLKTIMLILLGVGMNGVCSADNMSRYGFIAIEGMISIWIIYLPFSVTLSIICVNLKRKYDNFELWQYGSLFNKVPITSIALFLTICVMTGLPPFTGYVSKQFLYRATNNYSPFLMLILFTSSLIMLMLSLRFFAYIFFQKRIFISKGIHKTGIALKFYLSMIFLFFIFSTSFPGLFFNNYLAPSVDSLLNHGQDIKILNQEGLK